VIWFQRKHGLKQDGVIGTQTANAMGVTLTSGAAAPSSAGKSTNAGSNDVYLLAAAIHGEARGEPYIGKVAVGAVILNRVRHPDFPNTIAGVIYQPLAFTAVADGQINLAPDEESIRAARDALNGWDPTYGAIYYYNPAKATSSWIWSRPVHIVIGQHRFAT
jgi:N-acetylmuramoyl-L-alanine amidase